MTSNEGESGWERMYSRVERTLVSKRKYSRFCFCHNSMSPRGCYYCKPQGTFIYDYGCGDNLMNGDTQTQYSSFIAVMLKL